MKAFVDSGALQFIKDMEESFDCGSFCAQPLFYAIRPVKDGPPSRSCSRGILEDASGNTAAGAVAALSALLLFVGGFGASPLCTDFAGKSKSKE